MKAKKSGRVTTVHERLFNAHVVMIMCEWEDLTHLAKEVCEENRFDEVHKMIVDHGEQPQTLAVQFPLSGGGSLIWTNNGTKIHTLLHETVHAAHHLLKDRAVPLSSDTEEVYAYTIEYLFSQLLDEGNKEI